MVTARQKHGAAALSGAVALVLVLAGCGGDGQDEKPRTMPSPASPTPGAGKSADPQEAEKTAVLASYSSMWVEQMKAYRKADAKGTDVEKYVTLDALGQFRNDLARMKKAGTVVRGELGHENTTVTALDLDAKTPKATLSDCVDLSKWETYSTKRDEAIPLPKNQPRRYVATATAEKWPNGWMVTTFRPHGERSC